MTAKAFYADSLATEPGGNRDLVYPKGNAKVYWSADYDALADSHRRLVVENGEHMRLYVEAHARMKTLEALLRLEPAEGHTKRWQDQRRAALASASEREGKPK